MAMGNPAAVSPPGTYALQGYDPAAMYGHTPDNPMMPPGQPRGLFSGYAQGIQQQPPQFNPFDVGGRLAQMGVPPEAVAQAMREMGLA